MSKPAPCREDFEMEDPQLAIKTLEAVCIEGESNDEKIAEIVRVTVNNMPQWCAAVMTDLKKKHSNLPNAAAAERLTAKLGIVVVRDRFSQPIMEVANLRRKVYQRTDQLLLKKTYKGGDYELVETVATIYRKVSLREWTAGAIGDQLIDPLGLTSSTAVLLVLVAGISKSDRWVPKGWIKLANRELDHFQKYLKIEARRLKNEVLGHG